MNNGGNRGSLLWIVWITWKEYDGLQERKEEGDMGMKTLNLRTPILEQGSHISLEG